jgi:hypothetical protein
MTRLRGSSRRANAPVVGHRGDAGTRATDRAALTAKSIIGTQPPSASCRCRTAAHPLDAAAATALLQQLAASIRYTRAGETVHELVLDAPGRRTLRRESGLTEAALRRAVEHLVTEGRITIEVIGGRVVLRLVEAEQEAVA